MNASQIMSAPAIVAHPGTPIATAMRLLFQHKVGSLPVVDAQRRLVGIVSESDLLRARMMLQVAAVDGAVQPLRRTPATVADVLHGTVAWLDEKDPLDLCVEVMLSHEGRTLPVTRDGHVVGVVTRRDVAHALGGTATRLAAPPETLVDGEDLQGNYGLQAAS